MALLFEVVGLLGQFAFEAVGTAIVNSGQKSSDRRSFLKTGTVRCAVRAVEGRVLNIGTEWSLGSARLRAGHLTFTPTVGIVGDRSIDVVTIKRETIAKLNPRDIGTFEGTSVIVVTPKGELCVGFPPAVFDDVLATLEAQNRDHT
jgi:hypothetical protein